MSVSVPDVGGLGGALRTGEKPECLGDGGEGRREIVSTAVGGKRVGWVRRLMGAVFWRRRPGRALKGSADFDGGRVGDGNSGRVSSSSSAIMEVWGEEDCGWSRVFWLAAAAKMFLLLGMPVASVLRGESERQAMDMGDGSTICTSIGESNWVLARDRGPRAVLRGGVLDLTAGVESIDRLLRSVVEGKSVSALVLTDEECAGVGDGTAAPFDRR